MAELKMIFSNYVQLFTFYEQKTSQMQKKGPQITKNNFSFKENLLGVQNQIEQNLHTNEEIFKQKMKIKGLERELEKIKNRNKTLEKRQKEIVSKMKNLRSIQVDSEAHQRWNDQVDDLEIIVEDAELFLDSVVDSQHPTQKLFFGDSKVGAQSKIKAKGLIDDRNSEVLLEPLFRKLEEVDLSGFDNEEIRVIDRKVAEMFNPIECILMFVGSFEKALAKSKKKAEELISEQGE